MPIQRHGARHDGQRHGYGRLLKAGWLLSGGVMIVTARMWQLHLKEVEQRAEEAERTREAVARQRAVEERLRIARELHDSLTHSISVIQVQAGVAVHLARKRGEEVTPALLAIEEAGRDAGRELRATLGVLRKADEHACTGLDQLEELVDRARGTGLEVVVTTSGAARPLAGEVGQGAYRIVQEALNNVTRHAGAARAEVHLDYGPRLLTVRIDDDGAGGGVATTPGAGLGLVGMRERVAALGGRLQAAPRAEGGFRVLAELPVREAP